MTTRIQSPRWLALAVQVLEATTDSYRSLHSNNTTASITADCIKTLLAGVPLSDKQANALVANIRARVPGRNNFTWEGPIQLTKKQLADAQKNPKYSEIVGYFNQSSIWKNQVLTMVMSKLNEIEAHCESLDELQIQISSLYENIKAL